MEFAAKSLHSKRPPGDTPRALTDLFQAFVEKSWEGFSLLSETGELRYLNPATTRMLGYTAKELLGTSVLAWIHPEDRERITALLGDALAEPGRSRTTRYRCRHKDGLWVWLEGTATNLLDDPAVRGLLCNYRDVTDRIHTEEALRESEAELRAIFDLAAAGQAQADPRTGRFLRVNPRLCELTGYSQDELLGLSFSDITHPEDRERDREMVRQILLGARGGWNIEKRYLRKDGSPLWVQVTGSLIRDAAGQPARTVAVILDIDARKRAEAALLSSERRFRQLADLVPSFVWIADPDGRVNYLNDRWYAYTGLDSEQSLGTGWLEAIHPDDADRCRATWQAAIRDGHLFEIEIRYRRGDGRYRWFLARAEPLREDGHVVSWFGTSTDVHDRKMADQERANLLALEQESRAQAEAERERAAFLARASEILTSSLDSGGTLAALARLVVPQLADSCALFEVEPGPAVRLVACAHGDPARDAALREACGMYRTLSDSPESLLARVLRSRTPEVVVLEDEALRATGPSDEAWQLAQSFGCHSVLIVPIVARTEVLGLWCFCLSEPGRGFGEDTLTLVQELARRASSAIENARLYRDTRAANDAKDRFLATLSHELRTPLTPVLAIAPGLEEDPRLPADVRAGLSRIRRNVELEARLIDDLLDLTRISRGKIEIRPEVADAHALLEHALSTSAAAIAEKGLRLTADLAAGEPRIWADPGRMTQVFWNLLQNAVKFTPAGGTIAVRSRLAETAGEGGTPRLMVEISDTGIGIEPDVLPRIFDAFEQGQRSITRRFGGLGLGLALSKTIVELHGGRIAADSAGAGHGATFSVELPLAEQAAAAASREAGRREPAAPSAPPGAGPAAPPAALHILLVEDHADTAEAMAEVLRGMGHEVTVAGTVAEALAKAEQAQEQPDAGEGAGRIDLVVSDLGLPDGSGVDVMRELVRRYGLKGIALSGYGMEEDIRRSLEAGFARHLTKPVTPQTLRTVIGETAGTG